MAPDEATKIAKIMLTADGWCNNCQRGLFEQFVAAFPEHEAVIDSVLASAPDLKEKFDAANVAYWDSVDMSGDQPRIWNFG